MKRYLLLLVVLAACGGATIGLGSDADNRTGSGVVVAGAGGGSGSPGPCAGHRNGTGGACAAPLECETWSQQACVGPLAQGLDPVTTMPNQLVAHWPLCDCILVTVDPALHGRLADIAAAANLWADSAEGWLCFYGPLEAVSPGTLHVTPRVDTPDASIASSIASLAAVTSVQSTGLITGATIALDPSASNAELAAMVGVALGLELVPDGDTIMSHRPDAGLALSSSDVATIQALYGPAPYCW